MSTSAWRKHDCPNRRADRHKKRHIYQSQGVAEYWIVDPDARLVERWRPSDERAELISETLLWTPASDGPTLSINLPAFFRKALDETRSRELTYQEIMICLAT